MDTTNTHFSLCSSKILNPLRPWTQSLGLCPDDGEGAQNFHIRIYNKYKYLLRYAYVCIRKIFPYKCPE